jgi:P-type E1-E2 ATPase
VDKTGTLTHGAPSITRINALPPLDEDELLQLVASAEQLSSHVLAASIVAAAKDRGLTLVAAEDAREHAARGVDAKVGARTVSVGTLSFVAERASEAAETDTVGGELAIYVAVDGHFAGSIVAADPVRSTSAAVIAGFASRGIRSVIMLTGDAQATADHVAREVGISTVVANCLPADKVRAVTELRERPVLMIGDGVNDAPVLAAADVGIAMGARGATAASESADAVILVDDFAAVGRALQIGADTVRIAMQSIWLGMALSVGLMIVASFGVIPATLGAGIQEIVDLATVLNALRTSRSH